VGEYITRIVPMGTHEWKQYINIEDVEGILKPEGAVTIDKAGVMITNPLTLEMGEFPNWLRGNYMLSMRRVVVV
jgi:2-polyprenyl-3-methyl-5-hydroxy-6-metoxy-1,4-benzoquinol methylase